MISFILIAVVAITIPTYNVEKGCRATSKSMQNDYNIKSCVDDENAAKQKVVEAWSTYPAVARQQCATAQVGDFNESYVELLTCFQMQDWKLHLNDDYEPIAPGAHAPKVK